MTLRRCARQTTLKNPETQARLLDALAGRLAQAPDGVQQQRRAQAARQRARAARLGAALAVALRAVLAGVGRVAAGRVGDARAGGDDAERQLLVRIGVVAELAQAGRAAAGVERRGA